MAEIWYNSGKLRLTQGAILTGSTTLAAYIVITSKTGADDPDLATMAAIDAIGTVAFHGTRTILSAVTVATDAVNNRVDIDCGVISYGAAGGVTALAMIICDITDDTSMATRIPISFYDTGFPQPMDGGLVINVTNFARLS